MEIGKGIHLCPVGYGLKIGEKMNNNNNNKKIIVFGDKKIRRILQNGVWYFSVIDIVGVLTDSVNIRDYIKKLKQRNISLKEGWGQIVTPLLIDTLGGKQISNFADLKGIFRIIQSIPSKKAEPFKLWLAKVGSERIDEIENPELAQERMKDLYEKKGYSKEWIDKRLRGIAIRPPRAYPEKSSAKISTGGKNLTDEWDNREIEKQKEYAILTNEISMATFGKTIQEYRGFKDLDKDNLRDHMDDWELILTMIGEKATTDITQKENSLGFVECQDSAIKGGEIAGNTRKELEKSLDKSLISSENYLDKKEKEIRKGEKDKKNSEKIINLNKKKKEEKIKILKKK